LQIISYRPEQSGGGAIARVDIEVDGIRLNNLILKQTKAGLRVFGPNVFGRAAVTFQPDAASAVIAAIQGATANGRD
jgi:hypothetical protein